MKIGAFVRTHYCSIQSRISFFTLSPFSISVLVDDAIGTQPRFAHEAEKQLWLGPSEGKKRSSSKSELTEYSSMRARLFSILGHILVCASAREKEGTKARPPAFLLLRMLRRRALPSKSASAACGRFIIANFADGGTHATPDLR